MNIQETHDFAKQFGIELTDQEARHISETLLPMVEAKFKEGMKPWVRVVRTKIGLVTLEAGFTFE